MHPLQPGQPGSLSWLLVGCKMAALGEMRPTSRVSQAQGKWDPEPIWYHPLVPGSTTGGLGWASWRVLLRWWLEGSLGPQRPSARQWVQGFLSAQCALGLQRRDPMTLWSWTAPNSNMYGQQPVLKLQLQWGAPLLQLNEQPWGLRAKRPTC